MTMPLGFTAPIRARGEEAQALKQEVGCKARRWVVERTWSWLMCNRRLQIDYERDPKVTEGFVWAAHSRLLLRRLTEPAPT